MNEVYKTINDLSAKHIRTVANHLTYCIDIAAASKNYQITNEYTLSKHTSKIMNSSKAACSRLGS